MTITPRTLPRHELIGLEVEVGLMKGKVADETKNMIIIKTEKGVKKLEKKSHSFVFTLPDGKKVRVSGSLLIARPEERIRIKMKKW